MGGGGVVNTVPSSKSDLRGMEGGGVVAEEPISDSHLSLLNTAKPFQDE